ncbi:MAG TPA: uroporphyrinogen-III synthase [Saprospiraceae bacterium]|nr:uroporphyrinogen-III synthase [Saprospiraceae bacterium]HPN72141.1 uroporphyrinogen-III synthase [Saprospiraceae bacterium]
MTHKKSIFITTDIDPDSSINKWAVEEGHQLYGKSLIHFQANAFNLPDQFDIIFFYSKNAVKYFAEGLDSAQLSLVKQKLFGAIGTSTAAEVKEVFGKEVQYDFDDYKDDVEALNDLVKGKICLFPQAQTSRKTIEKALTDCIAFPIIVYQNVPDLTFVNPYPSDIIAFTSPLNVDAYLAHNKISNQQIVSIGKTTAAYLKDNYQLDSLVANHPSEEGILEIIKAL